MLYSCIHMATVGVKGLSKPQDEDIDESVWRCQHRQYLRFVFCGRANTL